MKKIKIDKSINYLSEAMETLPSNCLFNKGVVGGGGTTISLNDRFDTVIAVPFTELITNKVKQTIENTDLHPHIALGVYSGVTDKEIKEYLEDDSIEVKKIMVTYNSLGRVMKFINPFAYNLLVDEYHILFTDYSFRADAAKMVLDNYSEFRSYTFMTATPIEEEFMLEELKHLPVVEAVWENATTIEIQPIDAVRGITKTSVRMIEKFVNNEVEGNLYMFVNSVRFINSILKKARGLNNDNTRVIYSDYNETQLRIKRGKTSDAPKKINFITSKAFEGADIYDEDGKVVVVSDGNLEHTLLDISTKLIQITGRIRNTKYNDRIYHLTKLKSAARRYTENKMTYEEYKDSIEPAVAMEETVINAVNQTRNLEMVNRLNSNSSFMFFGVEDNEFKLDRNRIKIDLYNYKIANEIYKNKVNLRREYTKQTKLRAVEEARIIVDGVFANYDDVNVYSRTLEELDKLYNEEEDFVKYKQMLVGALDNFRRIEDAIQILGWETIRSLKYHKGNIENTLDYREVKDEFMSNKGKIALILSKENKFKNGQFYSSKEVREFLQEVYDKLGIEIRARGTDIKEYYIVKDSNIRIKGKATRGFNILSRLTN